MHQEGNNMRLNINMQVVFLVVVGMVGYWGPWMVYSSQVRGIFESDVIAWG
jgi:hypothetical protein